MRVGTVFFWRNFPDEQQLDIDEDIHSINASRIENNLQIEVKGQLPNPILYELYEAIRRSSNSKALKREIFYCFRDTGLTKLMKP